MKKQQLIKQYTENVRELEARKQAMTEDLRNYSGELYDVYIGERDRYMSKNILDSEESKMLVAVVGIAHLNGIKDILSKKGFEIVYP